MKDINEYFNNLCFETKRLSQVQLEIINNCNAACIFCFRNCDVQNDYSCLSYNSIIKILNQLKDAGAYEIIITGGEPLLHKDFIKIVKAARDRGFRIRINTNGTLLNETIIKELSQLYIRALCVSIHSLDNSVNKSIMNYNYDVEDVLTNINIALKYKIPVITSTVVCKNNVSTCRNDIDSLNKLNIKLAQCDIASTDIMGFKANSSHLLNEKEMEYFIENIFIPDNGDKFKEKNTADTCNAGYTQLYISSNGDVFPCSMLNLKYGNILINSIDEVLQSDMRLLLQSMKWEYTENCSTDKCEFFDYCIPCYGINYSESGSIFKSPKSLCKKAEITKKKIKKKK